MQKKKIPKHSTQELSQQYSGNLLNLNTKECCRFRFTSFIYHLETDIYTVYMCVSHVQCDKNLVFLYSFNKIEEEKNNILHTYSNSQHFIVITS